MRSKETIVYKTKYNEYFKENIKALKVGDFDYQQNTNLKDEYSLQVCSERIDVSKSLGLSHADLSHAEVLALFHDFG